MTTARAKMVGTSAYKMRRIANLIKGNYIEQVEGILTTLPSPASKFLLKLVNSAVANAENNDALSRDRLVLTRVQIDQGPKLKRYKPRSRGQAGSFNHPTSHVVVEVEEV